MAETLLANENIPTVEDYLPGENKKFKSLESLAEAKLNADLHAKTLERENNELRQDYLRLREEYNARAKLEELMTNLQNQQLTSSNQNQNANEAPKPIQPEEIESLVDRRLSLIERQRKESTNFNTVRAKLQEQFGNSYQNALKERIDEIGLTTEYVDELAKRSPQAFFRVMGLDQPPAETFQAPVRSTQASSGFKPTGAKKRTWSYYQELKKANPNIYYDRATAVQMEKDAQELGEAFRDGDYYAI
jgi:hypothetical protein